MRLRFNGKWVRCIMMCVESMKYKVLVNQEPKGPVTLRRDLRQGLYLFILCAQ